MSTTTKKPTKKLKVTNIGPVRDFTCEVAPGMNLLEAQNGAGKSCILQAISRAAGADLPVEVTDGATSGKLELDGTVLLSLTRAKAKPDSNVEVSLASVSPLAVVIEPGIKDRKAAETSRIRALLQLVDLKTTQEVIEELVDHDDGAVDVIGELESVDELLELDPVTASSKIKRALEKHKRAMLDNAEQAHGRWLATKPEGKPERLSKATVPEAQKRYDAAVGDLRQAEGEWKQRQEREAERAEIEATLGERPDSDAVHNRAVNQLAECTAIKEEIAALEQQLAVLKTDLNAKEVAYQRLIREEKATEQAVVSWDRRKAILDSEIAGATEQDVTAARSGVDLARSELSLAQTTAEYRKGLEASEGAREDRERYTQLAERYEDLAKNVPARLAGLLDQAGIPNLTVEDGVLTVIHENGKLENFYRLSAGQRTRLMMPLFIRRNPNRLVAFPEQFWNSLEAESKAEVAQILEENGVVGLTEIPTMRGEGLKVEHFETEV